MSAEKLWKQKGPLLNPREPKGANIMLSSQMCILRNLSATWVGLCSFSPPPPHLLHDNKESRRVRENCEAGHELKVLWRGSLKGKNKP